LSRGIDAHPRSHSQNGFYIFLLITYHFIFCQVMIMTNRKFYEERKGVLIPKSIVTFTEKTKFLYAINKGISGVELRRNRSDLSSKKV